MSIFSPQFPSQPTPAGATVATTTFPTELAPFIKDVLEKAKAQQTDASYQAYTGPQLAQFNERERAAMEAIAAQASGLAGTDVAQAAPYFTGAKTAVEGLGQQFTGDTAQQYMNPYQQAVVDQAKAKAVEDYESRIAPGIAAQAVAAQPFGGSRQAIAEGMARQDLTDKLTEIQERGSADAFNQGRAAFEAQKARELQQGQQFAQLGQTIPQQALRDLAIQQQIGEQERQQEQTGLDLAKAQFLEEREFPTRAMQEYSAVVRGFPFQPSTYTASTQYKAQPSVGQQLLQLGGAGLGAYTQFGGELPKLFGATGGGIADIIYNQEGMNQQMDDSLNINADRTSGPIPNDFIEKLIADPNVTDEQFRTITGFESKQQYLDTPKYGESSEEKAQPFIIPEQPGDRERGFGPDFQYLNEGGLPTVYNALGINDQAKSNAQQIQALIGPSAGVAGISDEEAEEFERQRLLAAQQNSNTSNLFNTLNMPDSLKVNVMNPNAYSDPSIGTAKDYTKLYDTLKASPNKDIQDALKGIKDVNIQDSKALENLQDRKSVIGKARTKAEEIYSKRGSPEELAKREKDARRRYQQDIGAAIVAGATQELNPNDSFVMTLSKMLGGTSAGAKDAQDKLDDFLLQEEDRALNASLGLINVEKDMLGLEGNLEQLQSSIDQNKLGQKVNVADMYLKNETMNNNLTANKIGTVLKVKLANADNKLKKEQLTQQIRVNDATLKLESRKQDIKIAEIIATYQTNQDKMLSDFKIAAGARNKDIPKDAQKAIQDMPELVGKAFNINIDKNGVPINKTTNRPLSPRELERYTRAIQDAELQIRNNTQAIANGENIAYNFGVIDIAAKYFKDVNTMVGTQVAPYLSAKAITFAKRNVTDSLDASASDEIKSSFEPNINLLQTLDSPEIGGDITELLDMNVVDDNTKLAIERHIAKLKKMYPNYKNK